MAEQRVHQWEYRIIIDPADAVLAELGDDGWELTAIDQRDGRFFFKRPHASFRERATVEQKARYYALWGRETGEGQ